MAMDRSTQNRKICDLKSFKDKAQENIENQVRSDNPSETVIIFTTEFLINPNHVRKVIVRMSMFAMLVLEKKNQQQQQQRQTS